MAVGLPLKTTYANGDVYSASDVNDTNGTINLLQTSTLSNSGGKNFIINGGMDIWQRGTSGTFAGTLTYPSVDRFFGICTGSAPTCTMSRQTADTQGLQYGMRFGRNSGQTNTGTIYVESVLETNDTFRLAGRTITFSFYAKAGANASLTALTPLIFTGTGTDQGAVVAFSSGWTGAAYVYNTPITVTTTMARYSVTVTLASTVREVMFGFSYTPTGTAGANEWYQIEGVQVEYGSYATTFSRAGGTIQGELAACQRYFEPLASGADATNELLGTLQAYSTTQAFGSLKFMVQKRGNPTLTVSSGTAFRVRNTTAATLSTTALAAGTTTPREAVLTATVASGLSAGSATVLEVNSASAYIWAESEL